MALATTRLSPTAQCVQYGYGQVEPNHLSARRNGQIYAQLPADSSITLLENGRAKCERCKRVYNLNNQGIPEQGEKGQKLYEYRGVTYNGNNTVEIRNP